MDLWEKIINRKDTDPFGTRMVKAHALTVLEKKYFKWACDLTSQIEGNNCDFKLEYKAIEDKDFDDLFE